MTGREKVSWSGVKRARRARSKLVDSDSDDDAAEADVAKVLVLLTATETPHMTDPGLSYVAGRLYDVRPWGRF